MQCRLAITEKEESTRLEFKNLLDRLLIQFPFHQTAFAAAPIRLRAEGTLEITCVAGIQIDGKRCIRQHGCTAPHRLTIKRPTESIVGYQVVFYETLHSLLSLSFSGSARQSTKIVSCGRSYVITLSVRAAVPSSMLTLGNTVTPAPSQQLPASAQTYHAS